MNSIVVIGPKAWWTEHQQWLERHPVSSVQYSPGERYFQGIQNSLAELPLPFWLLIYVPKDYFGVKGTGQIECACRVTEYSSNRSRTVSPWPTFPLSPAYHHKHKDGKYEFWFKVDRIIEANVNFQELRFHNGNGQAVQYQTIGQLVPRLRGRIPVCTWNDCPPTALTTFKPDQITGIEHDPASDEDGRSRTIASIVARRGQPEFRQKLIRAYEGRCAISGCDIVDALEAAHITPYMGDHTNRVDNGLLLRADIHTLFDLGKLAIHPKDFKIILHDDLKNSHYSYLHGKMISLPKIKAEWPSKYALEKHKNETGL